MITNISVHNQDGITLGELRKFINENLKDVPDNIKLDIYVANIPVNSNNERIIEIIYGEDSSDNEDTITFYNF